MRARHGRVTRIHYPDGSGERVIATVRDGRGWAHMLARTGYNDGPDAWEHLPAYSRADALAEHGLDRLMVRRWARATAGPARTAPRVRFWHRR